MAELRYPHVTIRARELWYGENVFAVIAHCRVMAKKAGLTQATIDQFSAACRIAPSYDETFAVIERWFAGKP